MSSSRHLNRSYRAVAKPWLQEAKHELRALQAAVAETVLYKPTDYHWLLLYEVLEVYSDGAMRCPRPCVRFFLNSSH